MENQKSVDTEKRIFQCMFVGYGCDSVFEREQDVLLHRDGCIYGILHACFNSQCGVKGVFENSDSLIAHSVTNHGLVTGQRMDNFFQLSLSKGFCLNEGNEPKITLIRYYKFNVGPKEDVGVALMGISDKTGPDCIPVVKFAPVISGRENDHFVRIILTLKGKHGREIELQAMPGQMQGCSSDCIAFQSPAQFLQLRYQAKMLQANGNELVLYGMKLSPNGPTVDVSAHFYPFRCTIKVSPGKLKQPYASFWEDLELRARVKETMSDGLYRLPSHYSSIILPQMRYQGNCDVIIESIHETKCMNALITGMLNFALDNQENRASVFSDHRFTKVLMLFPTVSQMSTYSQSVESRANFLGLTTRTLTSGHRNERIEILKHGADIILTTPTFLENATTNDDVWSIMTSKLVHVHIHNPDRFTWDIPFGILWNFLLRFNPKEHWLNTSAYTCHLTPAVERFLHNTLFVNGSSVVSIGEHADNCLARMGEIKSYHYTPAERANRVIQIMRTFHGGRPRKWFVIVKKMERSHLAPLKAVLDTPAFRGRVTYVYSESEVLRDRYNFFRRFNERVHSVLVGNSIALDLDEVKLADAFIFYDPAHHRTDATRVAIAALNLDGSFKPVFGIYTQQR